MALKYKLTYFPIIGLCEPIRFLFAYMGQDYEDFRFDRKDWYENIKATSPWGKTPILEIEGKEPVTQSLAITRYLGRKAGLAGDDTWEDLKIDEVVYVIDDLRAELAKYHYQLDERVKSSLEEPLKINIVPFYMQKLSAHIQKNNGYLANGKLSWADLHFAAISEYLSFMLKSELTDGYPIIKAHREKIYALPGIKEWVAKRPADIPPATGV